MSVAVRKTKLDIMMEESTAFKVKLELSPEKVFDGPLDVLLYMIKESKLSIMEIKLALITQPFLDYMNSIEFYDLEQAADFLEVATTLIEIKAKAMLPKLDDLFKTEEDNDPEGRLKEQLEQYRIEKYKLFKEAGDKLKTTEEVNAFFKEPDLKPGDYKIVLRDMTFNNLVKAYTRMLHRLELKKHDAVPKDITKDRFTVKDKIDFIEFSVKERKFIRFFELFDSDHTVSEIINTFLALLELLRMQRIYAEQKDTYEDITINYREEHEREKGLEESEYGESYFEESYFEESEFVESDFEESEFEESEFEESDFEESDFEESDFEDETE
jgi:segregation and condensation protein A